jgi:hypothetical protein
MTGVRFLLRAFCSGLPPTVIKVGASAGCSTDGVNSVVEDFVTFTSDADGAGTAQRASVMTNI